MKKKLEIIIKTNESFSTVAVRFEKDNGFVGDYEKFDCPELTDEQIINAVQPLMAKLLPIAPSVEEPIQTAEKCASLGKFTRTQDGKWIRE